MKQTLLAFVLVGAAMALASPAVAGVKAGVSPSLVKPVAGVDSSQYRSFDNSVIISTDLDLLPGENLLFSRPAGYKIGYQERRGKMQIVELIPSNETIENWSEMLTVLVQFGGFGVTPEQFYERTKTRAQSDCNGSETALIAKGEANGYPYALWRMYCPSTPKTGKPEYNWVKAINGRDSFYIVTKAFKRGPSAEVAALWMDYLQKVGLCDTRIPERACASSAKPEQ